MVYETDYYILEYSNKDLEYIEELKNYIDTNILEVLDFFGLKEFDTKINIKLFGDLKEFRNAINKLTNKEVPDWLCGFSFSNDGKEYTYTLSLDNYKKTLSHENDELIDLKKLIMHEIVHACNKKYSGDYNIPLWLKEGLALYLAKQDKYINKELNANSYELINDVVSYHNYLIIMNYALNNYGKEYILGLLNDRKKAEEETLKLYEEIKCLNERNK